MNKQQVIDTAERAASTLSARGVKAYDVYVRASASTSVEVREQKLDAFEESETWGVGIRVLAEGGRMGFAFSTGGPGAVEEAAAKAIANSAITEPDEFNNLALPPSGYPDVSEFDEGIDGITEQDKIARAMTLEKAAVEFDARIKGLLLSGDHKAIVDYSKLGQSAHLAVPTLEHYLPLLYVLGVQAESDPVVFFADKVTLGSMSMRSVRVG